MEYGDIFRDVNKIALHFCSSLQLWKKWWVPGVAGFNPALIHAVWVTALQHRKNPFCPHGCWVTSWCTTEPLRGLLLCSWCLCDGWDCFISRVSCSPLLELEGAWWAVSSGWNPGTQLLCQPWGQCKAVLLERLASRWGPGESNSLWQSWDLTLL